MSARSRVLLLAMTGLGNSAFRALRRCENLDVVGVLTPAREQGRFPHYPCAPLWQEVAKSDVPLFEGLDLDDAAAVALLERHAPALIVVASYPRIIPQPVIDLPARGVVNVHPSLLPKHRGATPTVWTLLAGEEQTGVTVHFIDGPRVDAGRIVLQETLAIHPECNDGTLRGQLADLAERMLPRAVAAALARDSADFPAQDERRATWQRKRRPEDAHLDLGRPAREVVNRVRAMTPYPGARLRANGKTLLVTEARVVDESHLMRVGMAREDELQVALADGGALLLRTQEMQP